MNGKYSRKSIVSIFDVKNPRLGTVDITVTPRGKEDGPYSFKLDFRVDGDAGTELAMNAMASAQVWHRRLDHLKQRWAHEQAERHRRRI